MKISWKTARSYIPALCAVCGSALAQNAPGPGPSSALPPAIGQAPLYDPGQLPIYTGRVQQFTLTPRGDIDGLILSDGTEVKTPPHLSTSIAYSVKPGDSVSIHGLRAAALPLIQAVSLTDQANGRTIVDNGPAAPPGPPGPPPGFGPLPGPGVRSGPAAPLPGLIEVQGRVRMALHGAQGEVNGVLLEDGTVLRLPPPAAMTFAALFQPGQTLVAEGVGFSNALGKGLEVRQLGASREQLNFVADQTRPRGKKPRRPVASLAPSPRAPSTIAHNRCPRRGSISHVIQMLDHCSSPSLPTTEGDSICTGSTPINFLT